MNEQTALNLLAAHLERMKPGYVLDQEQTARLLGAVVGEFGAVRANVMRQLASTDDLFDGPYVPGVRTIARAARQLAAA